MKNCAFNGVPLPESLITSAVPALGGPLARALLQSVLSSSNTTLQPHPVHKLLQLSAMREPETCSDGGSSYDKPTGHLKNPQTSIFSPMKASHVDATEYKNIDEGVKPQGMLTIYIK
jgi:hypothetical protein